ncbi:MAG: tetratricopeptide repeat protein [Hyphomicrobiaceae bacterium]|nr:tetratricopeptide repeat protein [Hyphomicrobiaceae bacterium]
MRQRAGCLGHIAAAGFAVALSLACVAGGPAAARTGDDAMEAKTLLGSYLAGRIARGQHDIGAAAEYYRAALDRDPANTALIEQALLMETTEGRVDRAVTLARRLTETSPDHRVARLVLGLEAAKTGRFADAEQRFKAPGNGVMEQLTLTLAQGWMKVAQNDVDGAAAEADTVNQAEWARFYVRYHKALMFDVAGKREQARAAYERIFRSDTKSFRVALAYAHHASAAGDNKLALSIIEEHNKKTGSNAHPVARDLADRLKAGETVRLLIETPVQGLAEIFYGLGEALASEGGISVGAIYLQMALYLEPTAPFALAALANIFETTKNYPAAIAAYDRIPRGTALEQAIDIRKAQNLNLLDRVDEAQQILEAMSAKDPTDVRPLDALGSMMRGRKRYAEAITYYNKVISLIPKPERKHWTHFYARGTSYERTKQWQLAETDLQKAMQLSPDQPLVLNYLGYSWVDQGVNLQQGLKLIEKAVQLKPDDGYIVDSLGWAHYRLGNYKLAVKHLERAVELRPEDPTLNDHLGDAFWRVGRKREAAFQWSQALTLKPEPEDATKIREKLEKGLPEVRVKAERPRKAKAVNKVVPKQRAATGAGQVTPSLQ